MLSKITCGFLPNFRLLFSSTKTEFAERRVGNCGSRNDKRILFFGQSDFPLSETFRAVARVGILQPSPASLLLRVIESTIELLPVNLSGNLHGREERSVGSRAPPSRRKLTRPLLGATRNRRRRVSGVK